MFSNSSPVRIFSALLATAALSVLFLTGCDSELVSGPAYESTVTLDSFNKQARVDVCHVDGKGEYSKITVAEASYDSHVAHGDGGVGDAVPGMEGYRFNEDCEPIAQEDSFDVDSGGGIFATRDGNVTLIIPAGAVNDQVEITVVPTSVNVGSGNVIAGTAFTFGPSPYQFNDSVNLRIAYDTADLPDGIPAANLRMAKLVDGAWQQLPWSVVDDGWDPNVSAQISSFSTYAVTYEEPHGCGELVC